MQVEVGLDSTSDDIEERIQRTIAIFIEKYNSVVLGIKPKPIKGLNSGKSFSVTQDFLSTKAFATTTTPRDMGNTRSPRDLNSTKSPRDMAGNTTARGMASTRAPRNTLSPKSGGPLPVVLPPRRAGTMLFDKLLDKCRDEVYDPTFGCFFPKNHPLVARACEISPSKKRPPSPLLSGPDFAFVRGKEKMMD